MNHIKNSLVSVMEDVSSKWPDDDDKDLVFISAGTGRYSFRLGLRLVLVFLLFVSVFISVFLVSFAFYFVD